MKSIMLMSSTLNAMFTTTKQPMNLIIIILTQTLLSTFMMSNYNKSSWFNYMLMIIFIGGMMVLFIYITSITPNEKNYNYMKLITVMGGMIFMLMMYKYKNYTHSSETLNNHFLMMDNEKMNLNLMFNQPLYSMTIMMMIYLFITLIVINKISSLEKGPLRMKTT
uniref:NADH-ubiquinone oxidoreductase chain 6 n=1 Tax=Loxilobus prominenoculus TaxID=2793212 RepID=A0A7U3ST02_9ORTH|nr:NADH dehydrogenase subunit 6 [Loxilobus prominenoculus]